MSLYNRIREAFRRWWWRWRRRRSAVHPPKAVGRVHHRTVHERAGWVDVRVQVWPPAWVVDMEGVAERRSFPYFDDESEEDGS